MKKINVQLDANFPPEEYDYHAWDADTKSNVYRLYLENNEHEKFTLEIKVDLKNVVFQFEPKAVLYTSPSKLTMQFFENGKWGTISTAKGYKITDNEEGLFLDCGYESYFFFEWCMRSPKANEKVFFENVKSTTQSKNITETHTFKKPEGELKIKVYGNLEIIREASKGSPAIIIDNSDPKGRDPNTRKRIRYAILYGPAWENLKTLFFNNAFSEVKAIPIKNPWRGLNGAYRKFIDEYAHKTSGRPHKWWIETR